MFCGNCGFELNDTQKFCPNCGLANGNFVATTEEKTDIIEETAFENNESIVCNDEVIETQASLSSEVKCENNEVCNEDKEIELDCQTEADNTETIESVEEVESDSGETSADSSVSHENSEMFKEIPTQNKPKKRILSSIVAIFLCIILASCFIATSALQIVRTNMSLDGISNALANVDIKNMKITDILTPDEIEDMGLKYKSDDLIEFIIDNVDQSRLEKPLTEKDIEEIIDNDDILNSLRATLSDNLKKLTEGKKSYIITVDDICEIVDEERDFIEDVVGYKIEDNHLRNLRNYLEDNYDGVFAEIDTGSFDDVVGERGILTVALDLTAWLNYVMVIICLLFIALIVLVLRSFRRGFKYIGITGIVCGVIEIAAAIAAFSLINLIDLNIKLINNLLSGFLGNAVQGVLWFGVGALVIGVALLTVAILIRVFGKRKKAKVQ